MIDNPSQLSGDISNAVPSQLGIFLEASHNHVLELLRDERLLFPNRRRLALENRRGQARRALAVERLRAGEHFIEDGAKRENVGPGVRLEPFDLLGRHVLQRAQHHAGVARARGEGGGDGQIPGRDRGRCAFRQAKSSSFTSIAARLLLRADESVTARAPTSMTFAGFKSR